MTDRGETTPLAMLLSAPVVISRALEMPTRRVAADRSELNRVPEEALELARNMFS